jgi:putative hydrolase of the HAD superfamily
VTVQFLNIQIVVCEVETSRIQRGYLFLQRDSGYNGPIPAKEFGPMIKSVISDLGKVLIDFDNSIFYRKISQHTSLSLEEIGPKIDVHSAIGQAFDAGRLSAQAFYEQVTSALGVRLEYDAFYAIYNDVFALRPAIVTLLAELKPRYRMVMLSNTDVMRFGFIRSRFPEVMFFDDFVLSYEVGFIKPDPRIYRIAVQKAGAPASACLFIDDRPENIEAARRLGLQTIHYSEGLDLEQEFQALGLRP